MTRRAVVVLIVTLAFSCLAYAQAKPDFSGTWVLDTAKSDMGAGRAGATAPGARPVTLVLKQTPAQLSIERNVNGQPGIAVYKLDGSESINKSPSGGDIKSTTKWAGATLVTQSSTTVGEMTVETNDVRSLSADGKTMTVDVTRQTGRGEVKQKLVYTRQ